VLNLNSLARTLDHNTHNTEDRAINNASCVPVSLSDGTVISWVDEMRYLGIFIVRSRTFKCCLEHAKKSFYRAANAVFLQKLVV